MGSEMAVIIGISLNTPMQIFEIPEPDPSTWMTTDPTSHTWAFWIGMKNGGLDRWFPENRW